MVVILSIITSLILPNFKSTITKLKHKEASDQLVYMMRYAQSRAVTQNSIVQIVFENNFTSYWLEQNEGAGPLIINDNVFEKVKGRFGRVIKIPVGFQIQVDTQRMSFFPDGTIDKERLKVCSMNDEAKCFMISTKEQRGKIITFKEKSRL